MKRSIAYITIACGLFLPLWPKTALAQISGSGWTALTSAGPAATTLGGINTIIAWKGAYGNGVWYTFFAMDGGPGLPGGGFGTQKEVPSFLTTRAPALAATSSTVYLVVRGQSTTATDNIYYTSWNSTTSTFPASNAKVCAGTICAQTSAGPAAAGNGSTLYVAWTTATNSIEYSSYNGSSWTAPATVPGASTYTNPVTGAATSPALAVYNNALFVAWAAAGSGDVTYSDLSLAGGSWSSPVTVTGAQTNVGPTLGINVTPAIKIGTPTQSLYLAWTAGNSQMGYAIDFASWDGSGWTPWNPPLPIPPGPIDDYTPALNSFITPQPNGLCGPTYYWFQLSYTMGGEYSGEIMWTTLSQAETPPPRGCKPTE